MVLIPFTYRSRLTLIDRDIRGTDRGILLNAARKCRRLSRYGFLGGSHIEVTDLSPVKILKKPSLAGAAEPFERALAAPVRPVVKCSCG